MNKIIHIIQIRFLILLMISFEFLHAGDEGVAAFDGLSVVARSTEATNRTVTLHANHTL